MIRNPFSTKTYQLRWKQRPLARSERARRDASSVEAGAAERLFAAPWELIPRGKVSCLGVECPNYRLWGKSCEEAICALEYPNKVHGGALELSDPDKPRVYGAYCAAQNPGESTEKEPELVRLRVHVPPGCLGPRTLDWIDDIADRHLADGVPLQMRNGDTNWPIPDPENMPTPEPSGLSLRGVARGVWRAIRGNPPTHIGGQY